MSDAEILLNYRFTDKELLNRAFTHPSYSNLHGGKSYQRLEFLGDGILDFVVADELCRRYPDVDEGILTKMRGTVVSYRPLAQVVRQKQFDKYIKMGFGEITEKVRSDIFESICGAIYIDGGFDAARNFIIQNLSELIDGADAEYKKRDYKTALYEKYVGHEIRFADKAVNGRGHMPIFEVQLYIDGRPVSTAKGGSKKDAQQKCCQIFLEQ